MKGREGVARLLSDSTTPNREPSESRDPTPNSLTNQNTSLREVMYPPAVVEPAASQTVDDPPIDADMVLSYIGFF